MPKPKENETKSEFMSRCMSYPDLQNRDQAQRAAICYALWDDKSKE